mgnify:CR=1 FL=1
MLSRACALSSSFSAAACMPSLFSAAACLPFSQHVAAFSAGAAFSHQLLPFLTSCCLLLSSSFSPAASLITLAHCLRGCCFRSCLLTSLVSHAAAAFSATPQLCDQMIYQSLYCSLRVAPLFFCCSLLFGCRVGGALLRGAFQFLLCCIM